MQAQITIGGNVYGGGNAGATKGSTKVTVHAGDINAVYGGARMADVEGNAFVNIDGEHASDYILINKVYGGNDISGTISATNAAVPEELTQKTANKIDGTWDAFVRVSTKTKTVEGKEQETDDAKKIYIGQLFGGGNGNYTYGSETDGNDVIHILKDAETGAEILRTQLDIHQPDLGKTYLELLGGSIVNVFGGGNMATVTEDAVIHLDNPSKVVNHIKVKDGKEDESGTDLLTEARFIKMGINYKFTYPNSDAFQIGNLFGGNNKVDMAIQPRWNLLGGKVRNLYSGGNEGRMTCPQGLLLVIPEASTLTVDNVYGGCRKADVRPLDAAGNDVPNAQIQLAENPTGIPAGFAARTRILGGNINNVYGGNDISGNVYGGNTVAILTTIHGNVYGGGNGSYAYTDNPALKDELLWRDFYYNPKEILGLSGDTFTGLQSAEALNKVRPNAEQVSLLLRGTKEKPVFVEGSVFVGGNSASLQELTEISNRQAHVKIGSYVTIDNLFLGNNGENMVKTNAEVRDDEEGLIQAEGVLKTIASTDIASDNTKFNSMVLTDPDVFDKYMEGCAMKVMPSVVFDDVKDYTPYSSQFGSFYCGGNVGSMMTDGLTEINFNDKVIIYDKIVGGCNKANVDAVTGFNAAYYGGFLGNPDNNGDKLKINFSGLKIQPMRWKDPNDKTKLLEWNTVVYNATTQQFDNVPNVTPTDEGQNIQIDANANNEDAAYIARRLKGGNIYGGCYESGHVNGNVILNINETLMERDKLFDLTDEGDILYENTEKGAYTITKRNTGVILSEQGMDVLGDALNVFGAGYGVDSEIWGSTTINLNKGYVFQIFGGGEMGAIGKGTYNQQTKKMEYAYDSKYSTYINLNGDRRLPGVARDAAGDSPDMAECEFIYGGAFEGIICGNTHIRLGNGRIFNSFAGSCNADILGHTETYIGEWTEGTTVKEGFPWIRDHIYGGNDLGGSILLVNEEDADFSGRIREEVKGMVNPAYKHKSSSYMEYTQGRVGRIFGGCFGDYDYTDARYVTRIPNKPYLHNSFVNFRPNSNAGNVVEKIFGAGEGYPGDRAGDKSQDHSYVLIDIPAGVTNFANTEVFGAGAYNGLGMLYTPEQTFAQNFDLNEATAMVDLMRGQVDAAYGGSYEEGITRRTAVNVPKGSTIRINRIFGGAYGTQILPPCDVYESHVNYRSSDATVAKAIYGGNNNERRTLYAKVNVSAPVWSDKEKGYTATVYGAGRGVDTWSEYTEVNLEDGASVYEVYGGGEMGHVLNAESVQAYMRLYMNGPSDQVKRDDPDWTVRWNGDWASAWKNAWTFGDYYDCQGEYKRYIHNTNMTLANTHLVRKAEMDDRADTTYTYNTNVLIHKGAYVAGYAYGGGYGSTSEAMSGDVYGNTYIALLGGTVGKDIYAAGTAGGVYDLFGVGVKSDSNINGGFTATANAYAKGGTARNIYGGGWRGSVGYHNGLISEVANNADDRDGETHVVIGDIDGTGFYNGIPAINRNVYGGGEGGGIFGTAYVTINNGRIGYRYKNNDYVEELDDVKAGDNLLDRSGNVFGGGYVANSYVDYSDLRMYGGIVRGGLYGGGEVGPIGRGTVKEGAAAPAGTFINGDAKIYKAGEARVTLYKGHVLRDVFGGGRGFDNWGGEGYMTEDEKKTMDLSSKGYVFGQTKVRILGGEVGTAAGVADGYGNVFGGGNVGYVYSGTGTKKEVYDASSESNTYYYYDNSGNLTEDCSVVITPWCQTNSDITIPNGGGSYKAGEYVPTDDLDKLKSKSSADSIYWKQLDLSGVIVHNAVFAGGNVTVGDNNVSANAKTVLGNVSANVVDVFNRDLITVGTEHVGGLYGDGNLTLVDGYRELNISNYGTDYYGMSDNISLDEYYKLTDRERAYFALEYQCIKAYEVTTSTGTKSYAVGQRITEEVYNDLDPKYKDGTYWQLWGFCSIYAGRLMNTIQRADFCGIFGSRLVMQGAKDRVPSVADKTDYTVNRVGEVSLNQVNTVAGETDPNFQTHGNYFGIYSVVNYMGGLTSDVNFYKTRRTTDNNNYQEDGKTFYQWKEAFPKERKRNNGKVANSVALASGVFLELTTEKGTPENKDWGYITGVAQLELINVKAGLGGGYVYAKNEHGARIEGEGNERSIISHYNLQTAAHAKAVTNKLFVYSNTDLKEVQTSGNFVHNVKQIIDDCYPTSNAYKGANAAPAHYWFIRGTSYVYDQYITAYTGVSNAYSKAQKIPLNINAASYGKIKLEDVKENLYAYYYSTEANEKDRKPLQNTDADADAYSVLVNNDVTYHLNDSISYWDWLQLSEVDQRHFVADTYVTIAECKIGNTTYPEGTVLLPADYQKLKDAHPTVYHVAKEEDVDFDYVFRRSNDLTHARGYVVTYAVDNPSAWGTQDPDCTYSPNATGVYGQRFYETGAIINKTTHDEYESMGSHKPSDTAEKKQAKMAEAYVTKQDVKFTDGENTYNFVAGTPLCKEDYSAAAWASIESKVELARVCTGTIEFDGTYASQSLLFGEVLTTERYNEVVSIYMSNYRVSQSVAKSEVDKCVSKAYICAQEGYYGGGYFEAGEKYTALKGWSSLSDEDRQHFHFNYDAFNLLIDPDFSGNMKLYDNNEEPFRYSSVQPIDYQAEYTGAVAMTYNDVNGATQTVTPGQVISRDQYEAIPNEQYHYSPVQVDATTVYVVNMAFVRGDTPYSVGQVITDEAYGYLTEDQKSHVTALPFSSSDVGKIYYYCREDYRISNDVNGHAVTDLRTGRTIDKGGDVRPGVLINQAEYGQLSNLQKNFTIQGNAPEELTTLYVAAQSDIFDLQKDRILTVIFSYDYTESDESGTHIEPISERHIVNIHIHFESGVPSIGTLHSPTPALPGEFVGLYQPTVKPGAYEIMGGGWEIFANEQDAERHRNGVEFTNKTPVYWYQDGQYLAYYAKTYLGKTYSNYVPFSVANYHDLKAVMSDMEHHLYVDHPDVKRASKIYINDYSSDAKSGVDLLKDLYDLTMTPTTYDADGNAQPITSGPLAGHTGLNNTHPVKGVQGMQNLDIFFHANAAPKAYADSWTPIASGTGQCYNGVIHGEGYHVDGLPQTFIGNLCGHVYNLGVSGSFTSAGLADTGDGYVENCWVKTTGTPDGSVYAVFGNPSDAVSTTKQMENCYYTAAGGDYKTAASSHGIARRMTEQQFYNGEVAYNLNGYYLKKRYNDQASAGDAVPTYDYVENRYTGEDIDFLYANGEIPVDDDVRLKADASGVYSYQPIWPDDYLFFGQSLTYGYSFPGVGSHQDVPSHLDKDGSCNTLQNVSTSNRVFRAPAYFGNKQMDLFHFNPYAIMAAKSADGQHEAYPGMTAVDFTGYNDKGYTKTLDSDGVFFAPVLDASISLVGVGNADETRNLLVYSPEIGTDNGNVLTDYFGVTEPDIHEMEDDEVEGMKADYRAVAALTTTEVNNINGHIAYLTNGQYRGLNHHVLVDKQDFNCPISYRFDNSHRMWYQRVPDNYVTMRNGSKKGWESVSLPFIAELVTTPQKGEISHFYDNSPKGHEYWLREFKGGNVSTTDATVFEANFSKLSSGQETKSYTNTFLWDYYYEYGLSRDINSDEYQNYYNTTHNYSGYPYSQRGTPYIVGFPGDYYYEFDLSGSFVPEYTAGWPDDRTLDEQVITFASEPGISIAVSDDELKDVKVGSYTFRPNYSSHELAAGVYVLNADGSSYDKTDAKTAAIPFRPYFTAGADARTRTIVFGDDDSQPGDEDDKRIGGDAGDLIITAQRHVITVESKLNHTVDVRIVNLAGITVNSFAIAPGEVIETRVNISGVYIVQPSDTKYTKKLAVK